MKSVSSLVFVGVYAVVIHLALGFINFQILRVNRRLQAFDRSEVVSGLELPSTGGRTGAEAAANRNGSDP